MLAIACHGGVAKAVVLASCPISRSFLKEEMFIAVGCNVNTCMKWSNKKFLTCAEN